jgi:hypothetical protein
MLQNYAATRQIELASNGEYALLGPMELNSSRTIYSEIVSLASGGFVVAWTTDSAILAQLFDRHGAAVGKPFELSDHDSFSSRPPSLAALPSGGFVATWESADMVGDQFVAAAARIFDAQGKPMSAPFVVNTNTFAGQQQPVATALSSGGFVVAWTDQNGDANGPGIRAQQFDAVGSRVGPEFVVNTIYGGEQRYPRAASLPDPTAGS